MKKSGPTKPKSVFQKQRVVKPKEGAMKSREVSPEQGGGRVKQKKNTMKTVTRQVSNNQVVEMPEIVAKQKAARTQKLIDQKYLKEGTHQSRSHSIRLQQDGRRTIQQKQTIKEGTLQDQFISQEDHENAKLPGLIRSNLSQVQIDMAPQSSQSVLKKQRRTLKSDLSAGDYQVSNDNGSISQRMQMRGNQEYEIEDDLNDLSGNGNGIEEEHIRLHINESYQRSASKMAFEKINKFHDVNEIEEEMSQNSMDEDDLMALKLNTIMKIGNPDSVDEGVELSIDEDEGLQFEEEENIEELYIKNSMQDAMTDVYSLEVKRETLFYSDDLPCLGLRKLIYFLLSFLYVISYKIANSYLFDAYEIVLTLSNIALFLSDSTGLHNLEVQPYQYVFFTLYFLDIFVQLFGRGLKRFSQDLWNFYDLFILIIYALFIFNRSVMPIDVSTFRVIRIPFYLSRLNNNLKIMITSIKESFKYILENILVLILFSVLLSLIALNLFQGVLKYRCMHEESGIFKLGKYENGVCGYLECDPGFICARQLTNIDVPTNYDKMQFAYTQIMRTTLINDWTITMYMLMKQFHPFMCFYYLLIIFIVDKFCFQLVIAVLKTYYHRTTEYYHKNPMVPVFYEGQIAMNLRALKNLQLWHQFKQSRAIYKSAPQRFLLQDFHLSNSFSSGSLEELMNKQVVRNKDAVEQANQDRKLLSARQTNEIENFKQKMRKMYSSDTWINHLLLPQQALQKYMLTQIDKQEENCLLLYDMELFYRFRTADFLSLIVEPKVHSVSSTSEDDVLLKHLRIQEQRLLVKRMHQHYQISDIFKTQLSYPIDQSRLRLPIRKRYMMDMLDGESEDYTERQHRLIAEDDEESIQIDQIRAKRKAISVKKKTLYQQDKKITFDQQLKLAQNIDDEETGEKHSNCIVIDGVLQTYDNFTYLINQKLETEDRIFSDYEKIFQKQNLIDIEQGQVTQYNWSGNDIIIDNDRSYSRMIKVMEHMNRGWEYMFHSGITHYVMLLQYQLIRFITHPLTQVIVDFFICVNTILLAFQTYFDERISVYSDIVLNILLIIEMVIKAYCLKRYFSHATNVLESLLILISTTERFLTIGLSQNEALTDILVYMRMLKAFFFFRVIKYNVFAQNILTISYQTFPSYANLALLLFFLILNYALFGLQIFQGKFPQGDLNYLHYFGNAYQAWIAVFDISTGDDWYGVVILSTTYSIQEVSLIYCITLIFIINYLTFGLLLAIILDGFNQYMNEMEQNDYESENDISKELADTVEDPRMIDTPSSDSPDKLQRQKTAFQLSHVLESLIKPATEERYINEVKCRKSLWVFSKANQFRRICYLISENYLFKIFMQCITWGSLINMILITYHDYENDQEIYSILQMLFNLIILLDGMMRTVAFGALGKQGYFNRLWMTLDFIYVILFFIAQGSENIIIQMLLLLGYLRPLKVVSYAGLFENERDAIYQSLNDIFLIASVIFLFWFVFGIFGMTIYKDKMGYCDNIYNFDVSQQDCTLEWKVYPHNFDTILNAMSTLFILSTFDGWGVIFFVCINSNTATEGPNRFKNEWPSYLFFVTFIFAGSLFFLGYFAGILFINFKQKKSQLLNPDLTLNQELFLKISTTIMNETPNYSDPPKSGIRLMAKQLFTSKYYLLTSKLGIVLNLIVLILYQEEASNEYLSMLNYFHHILSLVLFTDLCIKMLTYHVIRYFGDTWRKIEFAFVLFSIIDFSLDIKYGWFLRYARSSRDDPLFLYLRLFYVLRDLRTLQIIQLFTGIRRLLTVIAFNITTILRIVGVFLTILTCYSYVGCFLFGRIDRGEIMNDQLNYTNFFYAMLTLFKVQTKNGWRNIMTDSTSWNPYCHDDTTQCGQNWLVAVFFYFSFVMFASHVLMNLIVCELVDEFERFYDTNSNVIELYIENIDKFRNIWCNYTHEYKGTKMHTKHLAYFLLELGEPFGAQRGDNLWDAAKHASGFQLKSDQTGCVQFRGLLYECVKSVSRENIFKDGTPAGVKIMKKHDKKIRYRLYNHRDNMVRREVVNQIIDLESNFNILQEYLYLYMALKAWKSFGSKFFEAAGSAEGTVVFSESDVNSFISDASSDNEVIVQQKVIKRYPTEENLRRPTDVYILQNYEAAPKFRLKISYLDRIFQAKAKDNIIFQPMSQEQKLQKKNQQITLKKKQQIIKVDEHRKYQDNLDKPQVRNRYLYGYHDKMIIRQPYQDDSDRIVQSKLDVLRQSSGFDVTKSRRSVKFK